MPTRLFPTTLMFIAVATYASSIAAAGNEPLTFIETFADGSNVGDWTWGNNFERIVPQQGNTDDWRYNFNLFTCCPQVNTRWSAPSVFTGNYRENGVTSVGVDIARIFAGFANPGCHYNGLFVDTMAAGDSGSSRASFGDLFDAVPGEMRGAAGALVDVIPVHEERSHGRAAKSDAHTASGAGPIAWLVLYSDNGTPGNFDDNWGAYIAVEAHTVTPASGSGFNPNPFWESYDLAFPASWLESGTLPPGWTFIQLGPNVPPGAMQWQNLITNVSGIGWHLRDPGLAHLLQDYRLGVDNPRISMTASGAIDDCTGTGNPDLYDIAIGAAGDCHRNGVPDACEIADGLVEDCNDNGVPDLCDAYDAAYRLDTGYHNDAIGSGFNAPPGEELIWALRFDAGDGDVIENLSFAFHGSGGLQPGDPVTIFLWDDPNNDGNPSDAVLLVSYETEVMTVNDFESSEMVSFDTYEIEPTEVSGSFFIGAMALGSTFPAMTDVTYPFGERSWSAGTVDGDPTAAFQSAVSLPGDCLSGTYMIRANGNDANNSNLPDDCEIDDVPGDLNGDGVVNVLDLLILLEQWGDCDDCVECPADLNGDCTVNVLDLLLLLENWG